MHVVFLMSLSMHAFKQITTKFLQQLGSSIMPCIASYAQYVGTTFYKISLSVCVYLSVCLGLCTCVPVSVLPLSSLFVSCLTQISFYWQFYFVTDSLVR